MMHVSVRLLSATVVLLALTACSALPKRDPAVTGPFYVPDNVRKVERLPETVRRVALLPAGTDDAKLNDETLAAFDRVFAATLTRSARFEVVPLSRDAFARITRRRSLVSTAMLPADFVARVVHDTGADAIVFVDVTACSPYTPLALGLRIRLVDAKTGSALWNFDNLFSAAEPAVANSARAHALARTGATGTPVDLSHSVLQNPLIFADYASAAAWSTLPPR